MRTLARRVALAAIAVAIGGACRTRLSFPSIETPSSLSARVDAGGGLFITASPVDGATSYRVYYAEGAPPGPGAAFLELTPDELEDASLGLHAPQYFTDFGKTLWVSISAVFGTTESDRTAAVAAFVLDGPLSFAPSFVLHGPPGSGFGSSLAIGDFNRDGRTDLAVGAPGPSTSAAGGMVAVFPGRIGSLSTDFGPAWEIRDPNAQERFGAAVVAARSRHAGGDDVVVGAPGLDGGVGGASRWEFYDGGDAFVTWVGSGGGPGWQLGASLAAGDVDGDGIDDVVVGAPGADLVRVVLGSGDVAGMSSAIEEIDGPTPGSSFGASIAVLPRGAADASARLLVGAPAQSAGDGAFDLYAPPFPSSPIEVDGTAGSGARLGAACASLGDPDGDGHGDFVVGEPGLNGGNGAFQMWTGGAQPSLYDERGGGTGEQTGVAFAAGQDLDRDGRADLVATSAVPNPDDSGVWFYGGNSTLLGAGGWSVTSAVDGTGGFGSAAVAGDLDGDGLPDVAIGAPGRDEVDVFTSVPDGDPHVSAGAAAVVPTGATTVTLSGATFADAQPYALHRCEWLWDESTTPAAAVPSPANCTPSSLAGPIAIPLPADAADHWLRLRVTDLEDGRFSEATIRVHRDR